MKKNDTPNEGVYNADVFKVLVDYEITRSRRYPSPLALIEIEVKYVSSQESALQSAPGLFLAALGKHLRSVDIPSQMGNTFMALLPTTDENGVRSVCERLLSVFKNKFNAPDGSSVAFSLQIGATSHGGGSELSSEELFAKARDALKQSRLKGPGTYVIV
jgi:hypothetical protein